MIQTFFFYETTVRESDGEVEHIFLRFYQIISKFIVKIETLFSPRLCAKFSTMPRFRESSKKSRAETQKRRDF
jgi:hypothetical protein